MEGLTLQNKNKCCWSVWEFDMAKIHLNLESCKGSMKMDRFAANAYAVMANFSTFDGATPLSSTFLTVNCSVQSKCHRETFMEKSL